LHGGVYPVYRGRISTAHQGDHVNKYEQAIERMEAARENLKTARTRLTNAEDEMAAAERNLIRHEERPGIPLPQYRSSLAIRGLGPGAEFGSAYDPTTGVFDLDSGERVG
jgi:hypothetical protein